MWGREIFCCEAFALARDTPTCVGKRVSIMLRIHQKKGHPHVCGEETKENDMQPILK